MARVTLRREGHEVNRLARERSANWNSQPGGPAWDPQIPKSQPLRWSLVGAVRCRTTASSTSRSVRAALVAAVVGALLSPLVTSGAGATNTSTTLPGPAPNQSQIDATQSQVSQIEATLTQEEQQTSVLDDRYNTAVQNLQNAQSALQALAASLVQARSAVSTDKRLVATDAVAAYVYGTPDTGLASYFSTSANLSEARNQYTDQIVGNLTRDELALESSEARLQSEQAQQQTVAAQAQAEAAQAKSLAQQNEQEAAATKATLGQVQGQLAQEVAQAAIEEAQQEAAAAAKAASQAQQQQAAQAAAAAAAAAAVAGAVGGSASGAAATDAANQASGNGQVGGSQVGGSQVGGSQVGGSSTGSGSGTSAVQAAVSQLGVPYVFGGEQAGVGFDCSGLVQWAWGQAGVSIPRTTEVEWPSLSHVPLDALEPGDLLFYYNLDGDNQVDHVVMYAGSGPYGTDTVIQAPFTGSSVSYSPIFTTDLIGAARP
jgi:cell wall-associated NlpC family hydrolase